MTWLLGEEGVSTLKNMMMLFVYKKYDDVILFTAHLTFFIFCSSTLMKSQAGTDCQAPRILNSQDLQFARNKY